MVNYLIDIKNSVINSITSFFNSVKNIIIWFPVLWRDREYDYCFLLQILRFKLQRMSKFFHSDEVFSADAEQVGEELDRCCNLLTRLIEDDVYAEIAFKPLDNKWGKNPMFVEKGFIKFMYEGNEDYTKDFLTACDKEQELKHKDLNDLTTLLNTKLLTWWD